MQQPLALLLLAGVCAWMIFGRETPPAPADPAARFVAEFAGAYPARAHPTGVVREYTVEAAPARIPLVDGRQLDVWAYNGQVPGPTLRVRLGETLRVHVVNHLPQPTTIHWHGVRVPNAMDGVPGVTQPPIAPGERFTYEFAPKDAGTFWFHPHLRGSEQVERGLYGLLVVEEASAPPWSREVSWVLDDVLLGGDGQIFGEFNTRHDLMHDGRWGNFITVNGHSNEQLEVRPGERIRLRILNAANGRVFAPDFAGLGAQVIAVDGLTAAAPFDPVRLEIAPGNRIDLDWTVPETLRGQRFAVVDRFAGAPHVLVTLAIADEPPLPTPSFPSPAAAHVPAWSGAEAMPVRAEYRLSSRVGGAFGIEWTLNGMTMGHDHGQMEMGQMDQMGQMAHHPIEVLPLGQWSKLRFINESYRIHPMHLHGTFFKLLSRNGVPIDEHFFRDTVIVHAKETVEVGLVPLDEGRWMLHCHILEHAEAGMMTLFEVRK